MSGSSLSVFFVVAELYKPLTCASCMQAVLDQSASSIESDKAAFVSRMKDDEDGAALDTVCFRYSLLDPLTYQRMEHPVRSSTCSHLNCFDLKGFLQMYLGKEKMPCPVCFNSIRIEDLVQDAFVFSILSQTSPEEEEVEMRQDGEWSHCPVRPEISDESEPEAPVSRRVERPPPKPAPLRTRRSQGGHSIESFFRSKRFSMSTLSGRVSGGVEMSSGVVSSGASSNASSYDTPPNASSYDTPPNASSYDTPPNASSYNTPSYNTPTNNTPSNSTSNMTSNAIPPNSPSPASLQPNQPSQDEILNTLLSLSRDPNRTSTSSPPDVIDLCDDSSDEQCTIINISDSSPVS